MSLTKRNRIQLSELDANPLKEIIKWRELALNQVAAGETSIGGVDVDAMTLSTVTADGKPAARTVLFKGLKEGGLCFYTNYESDKGKQIISNPDVALVFYWSHIYRQIRIEGRAEKMAQNESEKYFASRPRESQLGALASPQSSEIKTFDELDLKFKEIEKQFEGKEIPCPKNWGGFKVMPEKIEFWVGQDRRLHQRICFTRDEKDWVRKLLAP